MQPLRMHKVLGIWCLPPKIKRAAQRSRRGFDPKTNQVFRFDPITGRPCQQNDAGCAGQVKSGQAYKFDPITGQTCNPNNTQPQVIRSTQPVVAQTQPEPNPEERRALEFLQREQEAMVAPTAIHFAGSPSSNATLPSGLGPNSQSDLAQVAALGAALSNNRNSTNAAQVGSGLFSPTSSLSSSEYDSQNMQTRKQQFLEQSTRGSGTNDYLNSVRTAPISRYEIEAEWEIPAVLEQSLNSDLPGDIKALVTSNVYDTATGQYVLIPQGSRLIGKYDSHIAYGQDGAQVAWNRIIFPDASSVYLGGMEGLDSHGNAGLRDKVDRHYKRLFGFAALSSVFDAAFDISQRQNQSVLTYPSPMQTACASAGREMSETGSTITRRNLNVQPTIKVPAGYKFTVRVNRDIVFEAPYKPLTDNPEPVQPQNQLRRRSGF
jgi:type IV secretion system protein TrbI